MAVQPIKIPSFEPPPFTLHACPQVFNWTMIHEAGRKEGTSTAPGALPKLVALHPSLAEEVGDSSVKD